MGESASLSVDPKEYAAFISQIELRSVWLKDASLKNRHGGTEPEAGEVFISTKAKYELTERGFRAFHAYSVQIKTGRRVASQIAADIAVEFDSALPMTDEVFDIFQRVNLPVNTWPFLREFVQSSLARIGWTPFTLPAYKVGTAPLSEDE